MTDNQAERVEDLGFDRVLERLRSVVSRLESGNLSLEDSLRAYEEGVSLARRGFSLLDGAEKRVELLVRDSRSGNLGAVPFDPQLADSDAPNTEDEDEAP